MTHDTRLPEGTMAALATGEMSLEDFDRELQALLEVRADTAHEPALTETREKLLALLVWLQGYAWPERTGPSDKLTYEAVIKTAIAANSLLVEVSRYTLAEQTGISDYTAKESLKRHVARGRFVKFPREDEARATPYRINLDVLQSRPKHREHSSLLAVFRVNLQQPPPDLFTGRGLSKAALRVYEALDPERPQKAVALGDKLKRHRSSVGRLLKRLAAFGLAAETDDGWLKLDADLERLAEEQGTAGATERKRAYHESLRVGFREFLKHKAGSGNGERPRSQDVQARKGGMVSTARETVPADGGTAIPSRSAQSLSLDHGRRLPVERMETLGRNSTDLLADNRPRLSVGGMAVGYGAEEREAACVNCGQVQTFTAPDLRPYSCAYCGGKFESVAVLTAA